MLLHSQLTVNCDLQEKDCASLYDVKTYVEPNEIDPGKETDTKNWGLCVNHENKKKKNFSKESQGTGLEMMK